MPKESLHIVDGEEEPKWLSHKAEHDLQGLLHTYTCTEKEKPRWCVFGRTRFDKARQIDVQHWIKPLGEDEFVAHRIAKLENELGADVKAHMTEWNPKLKGDPIYKGSGS